MGEKIKAEFVLSDDFLESIMVTMIESGPPSIWYWGEVHDIVRKPNLMVTEFMVFDGSSPANKIVNGKAVAKAIERLLSGEVRLGYPLAYIQQGVREDDAGAIDATAADAIAQVVLFGEVVYG